MKSGKEIKLASNNNNFKIITGAIENYKVPVSVYVNVTSWITTREKVENLNLLLKEYRHQIKRYLRSSPLVCEYFDINTIIDINVSPTGIKSYKPTFFALELNLYQKSKNFLPLVKPKNENIKDLKPILTQISNEILNLEVFTTNKYFNYKLTKKQVDTI